MQYRCPNCDHVYDEAKGAPYDGYPPGTAWKLIPEDWACPDCAVRDKVDFAPVPATSTGAVSGALSH
ncbi:MAG: rubredoxin [Pseudomonadota bacterium]